MKKIKLLPSIIMLALCFAVLGIGVYSATTGSNTISGTVIINAANPEVEIQVYNGSLSNSITGPITSRYGTTIPLGPLEFKTTSGGSISNANTIDDVADIDLIFKVTNNSSEKLGVYFADSVVGSALSEIAAGTREDNILVTKPYNTGLVTATFNQYYPVNASATIYYIVSFHLNQLSTETVNITLTDTLYLTVESYTSGLGKSMEHYSLNRYDSYREYGGISITGSSSGMQYVPSKIWNEGGILEINQIFEVYSKTAITSINIPDTVTSIYQSAFSGCTNLATITGAENVMGCGSGVVSSTSWWTAQTNNSVVYLGSVCLGAKGTCPSTVTITSGTKCIAGSAFADETALTSISIPNTVVRIGSGAFDGCTNLATITGVENVEDCGDSAIFRDTVWWTSQPNDSIIYLGSVCLGAKGTCPSTVTITSGTKCIAGSAFLNKTALTSISIPNTVVCINYDAFRGCTNLATITGAENLTSCDSGEVGSTSWWNAQPNNSIVYLGSVCMSKGESVPSTVTIRDGTKFILSVGRVGSTLNIPSSVVSIGEWALTDVGGVVNFAGTVSQWQAIPKGRAWDFNATFTSVVCSDGTVGHPTVTCCFVAGTKVTMAHGTYKNIEDVVIGDIVLSMDEDTGMLIETEVTEIHVKTDSLHMAKVYFEDGSMVDMTEYHPMYTDEGWHSITNKYGYDTLVEGDRVKTQTGWKTITSIELYEYENFETTYNLGVNNPAYENCHNYFANDTLVHNC